MSFVNYTGRLLPAGTPIASAANRGLRYGYALVETMRWENGRLPLGTIHWQRLFRGMETALFRVPKHWTARFFEDEVEKTVRKCGLPDCARVRLQVGPKEGGLFDREGWQLEYIIECFPLHSARLNENGLVVGISNLALKDYSPLSHLKTASAMCYAVAAREALANRWNDALLKNSSGNVGESSIANVFWVEKNGQVCTPPLSEGPVAGVFRDHLLGVMQQQGNPVAQKPLTMSAIYDAQSLFLTNAVRGIQWIANCGGTIYAKGSAEAIFSLCSFPAN